MSRMEPRIQYCTTSDGVRIAYAVLGDGSSIIYSSIFPFGVHLYSQLARARDTMDGLVASSWRVTRYDSRGTGSADREMVDFSLEARLADLEAVCDRVAPARFALVGHLFGTLTAIVYAACYPERLSAIAL